MFDPTECSSCHARIVGCLTVNGKWMPVDPEPREDGNLVLVESQRTSRPPWSMREVAALNQWQSGHGHPFTCSNRNDGGHRTTTDLGVLVATGQGWTCPDCDYTQDWAHGFMVGLSASGVPGVRVLRKGEVVEGPRYVSHFSTCPQANIHRKR